MGSPASLHLLAVSASLTLQADPSWGGMGPQQGPVGYQGRKRSNGAHQGSKQYAMEADAALAVLREQFPLYNQDSLTDVLKVGSSGLWNYHGVFMHVYSFMHTATWIALVSELTKYKLLLYYSCMCPRDAVLAVALSQCFHDQLICNRKSNNCQLGRSCGLAIILSIATSVTSTSETWTCQLLYNQGSQACL